MSIRCDIVSQDRMVYQGEVDFVLLPGVEGVMGILPHHAPVLTLLQFGIITVRSEGNEEHFTVAGGIAEVQPDQVTILADAAENVEELDIQRAEEARRRAEESLKSTVVQDPDKYLALQAALRRSNLRLDAIKRYNIRQRRQ